MKNSINIVRLNDSLRDDERTYDCGRHQYNLGLGNPWSHVPGRQVIYGAKTKEEALEKYDFWLKSTVRQFRECRYASLAQWEQAYVARVFHLCNKIEAGLIDRLGCYCANISNYTPKEGEIKVCHTQTIYETCLQLIKEKKNMS